jgi:hypothetical protein
VALLNELHARARNLTKQKLATDGHRFTRIPTAQLFRGHYTSGALYDKLHISHDGYADAVPIVHKSAAVSEVIAQLAIEADEDPE